MITLWCGQLGSGKTFCAVSRAIRIVARGSWLVTNIELKKPEVEDFFGRKLDWSRYLYMGMAKDDLQKVETLPEWCPQGTEADPVTVMIDECSEWIDAYFDGKKIIRFMSWLRISRHLGIDIQLITQDEGLVQRRVRLVVGQVWRHSDGSKMRIPHIGLPLPAPWRWCFASRGFDRTGKVPLTNVKWENRDKQIWNCYHTTQLYERFGGEKVRSLLTEGEDMKASEKIMLNGLLVAVVVVVILQWRLFKADFVRKPEVQKMLVSQVVGMQSNGIVKYLTNSVALPVSNVYSSIQQAKSWALIQGGNVKSLIVDGEKIIQGRHCRWGRVMLVGSESFLCIDSRKRPVLVKRN